VTTDDLQKGLPAARRSASAGVSRTHFFSAALICLASFSAQAQTADTPYLEEPANRATTSGSSDTAVADGKSSSIRDKANDGRCRHPYRPAASPGRRRHHAHA
jgi:hypothetical protein